MTPEAFKASWKRMKRSSRNIRIFRLSRLVYWYTAFIMMAPFDANFRSGRPARKLASEQAVIIGTHIEPDSVQGCGISMPDLSDRDFLCV